MVLNIETEADSLKWTLFQSSKKFLTFAGLFSAEEAGTDWLTNTTRAEEICLELGNDCVALEVRTDSRLVKMLDHIDLETFQASPDVITRIRLVNLDREARIEASNSWDLSDIDYCCPENKLIDLESIQRTVEENIGRISCDISQEEFEDHYVR